MTILDNIYLSSGYLDFPKLVENTDGWLMIFGGRGVGKTYGALKYVVENNIKFFYIRRLQTQIDEIKKPTKNPFKKLNKNLGIDVQIKPEGKQGINFVLNGQVIGVGAALSTIANIRGFDGDDIEMIIFDEFIPERHEAKIMGEAEALYNGYETINRNRELEDPPRKPVKLVCLANANAIDCPLFLSLGLVTTVEKMKKDHTQIKQIGKDITLVNMERSPISKQKENTLLYRVTAKSDFSKMALDNAFAYDDFGGVYSIKLKGFKPLATIGEITIYKNTKTNFYYVSEHLSGSPKTYGTNERERKQFQRDQWRLYNKYIDGKFIFENYLCKALFLKYIDS